MKSGLRAQAGLASLELAIVAPILVLMILAVAEFGRLLYLQVILSNAVEHGARYFSAQAYVGTSRTPDATALALAIQQVESDLGAADLFPASPAPVVSAGILDVGHVRVSASFSYSFSNPFLVLMGGALSNPLELNASATHVVIR